MMRFTDASLLSDRSLYLALSLLAGCSVYDPELLIQQHRSPSTGQPEDGGSSAADSAPNADPEAAPDASVPAADSGKPSSPVPVDTTQCGDGRVTGQEKCDVNIPTGGPGACPKVCPELGECAPRALNGAGGCQAECVLLELLCKGGDACCPAKCDAENDSDCSTSCGDGIVQESRGETCEPETATPCKHADADCDDDDACTVDTLMGNATNCNTVCANTAVIELKSGDDCCPGAGDANTDDDCMPRCGNAIREGSEECDGGSACDASCKVLMTADLQSCLAKFGGDECGKCSCTGCTETYLACRNGPDQAANDQCNAVLMCAQQSNCYGDACYCGNLCALPNGPCKLQVETAAGSADPLTILARATDPNFPLGRSYLAEMCRATKCSTVCR